MVRNATFFFAGLSLVVGCGVTPARSSADVASTAVASDPAEAATATEESGNDSPGAEPEMVTVHGDGAALEARSIPNVFVGLSPCPAGTERADLRTEALGEVACRDAQGQLQGPYASNRLDPTSAELAGVAERGQYEAGVRVGTWFEMQWSGAHVVYDVETYKGGQVVERRPSIASATPPWRPSA